MRIDVHAHYWTDAYLDMLVDLGRSDTATQRGIGAGDGTEFDARLRLMDRAGVDLQVLSAAPQLPYAADEERAVSAARTSTMSTPRWSPRIGTVSALSPPRRCLTSTHRSPNCPVR
jgi:hypothetical protein